MRMIGYRLALIADELDARYGRELDQMVSSVMPSLCGFSTHILLNKAYDVFQKIAKRLAIYQAIDLTDNCNWKYILF